MKTFERIKSKIKSLTRFERILWICSVAVVIVACLCSPHTEPLADLFRVFGSVVGVTSLLLIAKGYASGQFLMVLFALLYAAISFRVRYYGEMLTYLCMSGPIALVSGINWLMHPFRDTDEVAVSRLGKKGLIVTSLLTVAVTVVFFFLLKDLGTANLLFSTLSVTTSFFASAITFLRSPWFALAYASNDVVLIVLWIMMSARDISYLPMIACFLTFLFNDFYGFLSWRKREKKQRELTEREKTND